MKLINDRYKIIEKIKTDSIGTIFRVQDKKNNDKVVRLKLFSQAYSKNENIQRISSSFYKWASVEHPFICSAYKFDIFYKEAGKSTGKNQFFYTFEDWDDNERIEHKDLKENERISVIFSLCKAISYLHFRGMFHGHINFETIMLFRTKTGVKVKLKNMAFIGFYKDMLPYSKIDFKATLAPEVFWYEKAGASADVYALGILVYHLHGGKPLDSLAVKKIKDAPEDMGFISLIKKSIAEDLRQRISTAQVFTQKLASVLGLPNVFDDKDAYNRLCFRIGIVGRTKILGSILKQAHQHQKGYEQLIVSRIYGSRGLGKTRCLKEILYKLRIDGFEVVYRELDKKSEAPFGVFKSLLFAMLSNGKTGWEQIQKYGPDLVKIFPEMKEQWQVTPSPDLEPHYENLRLANRIYNFFCDYGQEESFVFVIDNLEFLSSYEHMILNYMTSTNWEIPIFIIASHESTFSCSWFQSERNVAFELNTFTYEQGAEFVRRMLGQKEYPIEITAVLMKNFQGNPLKIQQWLHFLFSEKRIYVTEERKWFFHLPSIMEEFNKQEMPSKFPKELLLCLKTREKKEILEFLSVFGEPLSLITLDQIFKNMEIGEISDVLEPCLKKGYLVQKLGDWGYAYDFKDRSLRNKVFNSIERKARHSYHEMAAKILIEDYNAQLTPITDGLIYHLTESEQAQKAESFCIIAAEQMERLYLYKEAIRFYERAIEIKERFSLEKSKVFLLNKIGVLYKRMGDMLKARTCFETAQRMATEFNECEGRVDATNRLSEILFFNREKEKAMEMLKESKKESRRLEYVEGELEAMKNMFTQWFLLGEYENLILNLPRYIDQAIIHDKIYFQAHFYNSIGLYKTIKSAYAEGEKYLETSLVLFQKLESRLDEARIYNNMGFLYSRGYGDTEKARKFYKKSLHISQDINALEGRAVYLYNIGESYLSEEKFESAIVYFDKAVKLLKKGDVHISVFNILDHLCEVYVKLGDYRRATKTFHELNEIYEEWITEEDNSQNYFVVSCFYYIQIKNFQKARESLSVYMESEAIYMPSKRHIVECLVFWIDWVEEKELSFGNEELFLRLEKIIEDIKNQRAASMARFMLLNIGMILVEEKKWNDLKTYLDFDKKLSFIFDSEFTCSKRKILCAIYEKNDLVVLKNILENEKETLSEDWRIFANKQLGDRLKETASSYQALCHYFVAFEGVKSITAQFSEEEKKRYLFFDKNKMALRSQMEEILIEYSGLGMCLNIWNNIDLNKFSINNYFNVRAIEKLYNKKAFLMPLEMIYKEKYGVYFEDFQDLVCQFTNDEKTNLYKMLIFTMKETLADVGCLYIEDRATHTWEMIKSKKDFNPPNLRDLIAQSYMEKQGFLHVNVKKEPQPVEKGKDTVSVIFLPLQSVVEPMPGRESSDIDGNRTTFGYLYLKSKEIFNRFNQESFLSIQKMADMFCVMIQNHNLKRHATIDKLTGVYLRSFVEDRFSRELKRQGTQERKLSVIMCDIDKFKFINDRYGHRRGDEILRSIGLLLRSQLRKTDFVGRYGGEEFILILPDTNSFQAFRVSEKIRKAIEKQVYIEKDESVTVSFGVATYPEHGRTEEALIEKADQALYNSKNTGRNRTSIWNAYIGAGRKRLDKLAGILTGNMSKDARHVQAIIEMLEILKSSETKEQKLFSALSVLLDITQAAEGLIVGREGLSGKMYGRQKGKEGWAQVDLSVDMYNKYKNQNTGAHFVHWEEPILSKEKNGKSNWKSMIIMPLRRENVFLGMVFLTVFILEKEFEFNDYNFVHAVSGVIMKILEE